MPKEQTIVELHEQNFDTLLDAVKNGRVALMDCTVRATGEHVATICVYNINKNGTYSFIPFATFFNSDPYEILDPPLTDDELKNAAIRSVCQACGETYQATEINDRCCQKCTDKKNKIMN